MSPRPLVTALGLLALVASAAENTSPLRLSRENPRYLEYRGRTLPVIGSGEHYGAVLNAEFDFRKYLQTLGREGLNHTRLFTGATYVEPPGAFNITRNTLAPAGEKYLAPWARGDQPGYTGGGQRFDLDRWNEAYFARLRDFIAEADRNQVIVEVNLFCPFYEEPQWKLSPLHPDNNVQGAGRGVARTNVYTLDRHGGLLAYQERFVDRVVAELRDFGNIYYEICNEPYFGGVTLEWQAHIARRIAAAQQGHAFPKLISQNIANNQARVERRLDHVDLYNFHYAAPPDTVPLNWHLERPIGDNETGFRGTNDAPYRMEAWDFMLAGGALFSHLDYSFAVGHEDGTFSYPSSQPGGGNPTLRRQFRVLREFLESAGFAALRPDSAVLAGGVPDSHSARVLSAPGRVVLAYFRPFVVSQFSVRWSGFLEVPEAGDYTLHAASNDGMRVWVDGRPVIDRWVEQTETEHTGTVRLEAGLRALKVEYFYNGGQAAAKLAWSRPRQPAHPVPASAFRQPDRSSPGLKAEYFAGRDFNEPWRTRVDPEIQFAWGTEPPFGRPNAAGPARLQLRLPQGAWQATWLNPRTGETRRADPLQHPGGMLELPMPATPDDIALRMEKR